jgi:hypothetical protein
MKMQSAEIDWSAARGAMAMGGMMLMGDPQPPVPDPFPSPMPPPIPPQPEQPEPFPGPPDPADPINTPDTM